MVYTSILLQTKRSLISFKFCFSWMQLYSYYSWTEVYSMPIKVGHSNLAYHISLRSNRFPSFQIRHNLWPFRMTIRGVHLQVRVLQPVPKVAVHNECGLPIFAWVGSIPAYAKQRSPRLRPLGHGDAWRCWCDMKVNYNRGKLRWTCWIADRGSHLVCFYIVNAIFGYFV